MAFMRASLIIKYILPLLILIQSDVKCESIPEIFIDTPTNLTVFKGQSIELRCVVRTTHVYETEFKWILPDVEQYVKEDRDKRVVETIYDVSKSGDVKILKLKVPLVKYQDRGEYLCIGNYTAGDYYKTGRTLVIVEEHSGFAPAIWILVGFLLMTVVSIGVIIFLEMKGISKAKLEEDAPINTVQF